MFRDFGAAEMLFDPIVIDSTCAILSDMDCLLMTRNSVLLSLSFRKLCAIQHLISVNTCFHFGKCVLAVFKLEWHIYLRVISIHVDVTLVIICNFEER